MLNHERLNQQVNRQEQPSMDIFSILAVLPDSELRRVRFFVDQRLPNDNLSSLNLEEELVRQFLQVRDLQDEVIGDDAVAPNQKAQVANSVASTLSQLIKLQEDLKREQTLKLIESVLIELIKMQPEAFKKEFFEEYEARARKEGLMK